MSAEEQMAKARGDLLLALRDWKDAGGSIISVMGAIEFYVMASIERAKTPLGCHHVGCTIKGPHVHTSGGPQQGTRE